MTTADLEAERKRVLAFLAQPGAEDLLRHLGRRWRTGAPGESGDQMLNRLGRLDALADIERLREQAKET